MSGEKRVVPKSPQGDEWEMQRAIYMIEYLFQFPEQHRDLGLCVLIEWWAPKVMKFGSLEQREKLAFYLREVYGWRYNPISPDVTSGCGGSASK